MIVYIYIYTYISDLVVLKPYLIKTTGPLIRVVGDRYIYMNMLIFICVYVVMNTTIQMCIGYLMYCISDVSCLR
jgi:hypothetical protein